MGMESFVLFVLSVLSYPGNILKKKKKKKKKTGRVGDYRSVLLGFSQIWNMNKWRTFKG